MRPLPRSFYRRDAREVAVDLLNKVLVAGEVSGRIVEVEAYMGSIDPASHSYRGETARNRTMFGPPGHLYVYFTYGMHWCANAVCAEPGVAQAVLLRALAPVTGVEIMRGRRGGRRDRELCSGPAKLCQALGIDGQHDGADLVGRRASVRIGDDGVRPPSRPGRSGRIGISKARAHRWRWFVEGNENVSVDRRP